MSAERDRIIDALREAFSGDEFAENAQAAAGEGEWSWFRWLAMTTVEGCPIPPEASECPSRCGWNDPCPDPWHDRRVLPPATGDPR